MRIQVEVPDEIYEQFKVTVARHKMTMSEVLRERIVTYIGMDEMVVTLGIIKKEDEAKRRK